MPISRDIVDSPGDTAGQSMIELRELRILIDCCRRRQQGSRAARSLVRLSGMRASPFLAHRGRNIATAGAREADPFFIRRVQPLIGPLPPGVQLRPLIVGPRLPTQTRAGRRQLRAQLWTRPGVFLSGTTQQQARRWAMRQARPFGGTVTAVDQHAGGRPHFHIEFPPGAPAQRSGHIFYGTPPAGSFFEFDDI